MPSPQRHLSVNELSQRASTGLAIRKGQVKISDPIPSSYVHNGVELDGTFEQPQPTPRLEGTWPRRSDAGSAAILGKHDGPPPAHISRFTERTSIGPSLVASSNMSATPSKESIQRRGTGLRATIRRMFSSKKDKNASLAAHGTFDNSPSRAPSMGWAQQPLDYRPSPLHYSNLPQNGALNSHAPSSHLRVESESMARPEVGVSQLGVRRNTVPSLLVLPQDNTAEGSEPLATPSKPCAEDSNIHGGKRSPDRPRTASKRYTPSPIQLKRRSRSADALADLLRSPAPSKPDRRDRTEEIAYWRNSIFVDPSPPLPETTDESVLPGKASDLPSTKPSRPSFEPVQDFDFGLGETSASARPATLQERVNTLEVKLVDFECAIAKLQGVDVTRPNIPRQAPRRKSLKDLFPESGDSSAQESSSTNDLSYISTPSDQWVPKSPREKLRPDRTSKATTIKPLHGSSPSGMSKVSSHSPIRFTRDEYERLKTLVEGEKTARQRLEIQVMNLQKEVDILKAPIYAYVRPAKYPTPSPESAHEPSIIATSHGLRRSPPPRTIRDLNETSRFSMSETEPDTDADNFIEGFETPQEASFNFDARSFSTPRMI